jgi:hypothetical protein
MNYSKSLHQLAYGWNANGLQGINILSWQNINCARFILSTNNPFSWHW